MRQTWPQYNFETAFLNAPLKEEVYVRMPESMRHRRGTNGKERVWKLKKSLYGLKQAPRDWHEMINNYILGLEIDGVKFVQSKVDTCLYYYKNPDTNTTMYFCLYVDDMTGGCNNEDFTRRFVSLLKQEFKLEAKDQLHWLLQMEIKEDDHSISINQTNILLIY